MKRRRIYFVPGLISLIGLGISLYFFEDYHQKRSVIRAVEVNWWVANPNDPDQGEAPPTREYMELILTGHPDADQGRLENAKHSLKQMIEKKSYGSGIHLRFSDKAEYWTLVKAIDITSPADTYFVSGNDMWIVPFTHHKVTTKTFRSFRGSCTMHTPIKEDPKQVILVTAKAYWPIFLSYTAVFISAIVFIRRLIVTSRSRHYARPASAEA
ncbi:MAG: hypothetical protein ACOYXT_27970 [Bacteroidota bacterium]